MRIDALSHGTPLIETRIHLGHELGSHTGILGQVDAAACLHDHLIESIEQRCQTGNTGGDVEGECPPRGGEGQW